MDRFTLCWRKSDKIFFVKFSSISFQNVWFIAKEFENTLRAKEKLG